MSSVGCHWFSVNGRYNVRMGFPKELPVVSHNLLQTFILGVVSGYQDGMFCILMVCMICQMEAAMPVHPSSFDVCILEKVDGVPSV